MLHILKRAHAIHETPHRPHIWWPLVFVWAGGIFFLSSRPDIAANFTSLQTQALSVIAHLVEYFVLAWLLMYALRSIGYSRRQALIITTALAVIYGVTDEFHQSFVPGRTPSSIDVGVDALGAGFAMWVRPRVLAFARRNKKHPA